TSQPATSPVVESELDEASVDRHHRDKRGTPIQNLVNNTNEIRETDSERLNATVIGLAIRLGFLGVILYLSLSIIRPLLETMAWSILLSVTLYPVYGPVAKWLGGRRRLAAALIAI